MLPVSKQIAGDILKGTRGKIFSVAFVKRSTGEVRQMNCRTGVKRYTTGEGLKYNASSRDLLPVYDLQARGYRMISLNTVISFKAHGAEFYVPDNR